MSENDNIIHRNKELILPSGEVKNLEAKEKKRYFSDDGREITDPIIVSAAEYTNITAAVQMYPMLRRIIILLRAGIDFELDTLDKRNEVSELEPNDAGVHTRLQDIADIATKQLGPNVDLPSAKKTVPMA